MAFIAPHTQILHWRFKNEFLYSPCQKMARFANRCATEIVQGDNDFQNIEPQVDGVDYDPTDLTTKYRPLPFVNWASERVGFSKWGHTWNYAIPTEDLNSILPSFKTTLANRARQSWERFLDRVMAGACDLKRVTVNATQPGRLATGDLVKSNLPDKFRYINKDPKANNKGLQPLDVNLLKVMAKTFSAAEVMDYNTGMAANPVCVARHEVIYGLLDDNQYINRDFASLLPLQRGEFNLFMGFEFIKTAMVDALDFPATYVAGTKTAITSTATFSAAGNQRAKITGADANRILFCHPMQAFAKGIYPQAGYMHVWQNPGRGGAFEYYMKQVLAYKRKQNEYLRVAYVKRDVDPAAAPPRQAGQQALNTRYETNKARNAGWNFALKGPS